MKVTLRKLSHHEILLLALCACATVAFLYYSLILQPMLERISSNRAAISQSELILEKYRTLIAQQDSITYYYRKIPKRNVGHDQFSSHSEFTSQIQSLANQSIPIISLRPIERQANNKRGEFYALELETRTDFESLLSFIHSIEKENAGYRISRLNLTKLSGDERLLSARLFIEAAK